MVRRRQNILEDVDRAARETYTCQNCNAEVLLKDRMLHEYFDCPERMVRCEKCKKWINGGAKSMLDHLDEYNMSNTVCEVVKRKRRQRMMAERALERRLKREEEKQKRHLGGRR